MLIKCLSDHSEGLFSLPFVARTRQNQLRTVFANALQIRCVIVVGYQNLAIEQGYTLATPTFYAVGGGAISIQDIKPSANASTGIDGINFVKFQLLDENSEVKLHGAWHRVTRRL